MEQVRLDIVENALRALLVQLEDTTNQVLAELERIKEIKNKQHRQEGEDDQEKPRCRRGGRAGEGSC
jgi:rRNA-processing protein FCF1